jgi:hypothetical protein
MALLVALIVAAWWVDVGTAASPDPHPSAKKSQAPAPDAYQPPASTPSTPSTPTSSAPEPTVTQTVIQVETTPSTAPVDRTPARPATNDRPAARIQKKPAKQPEKPAVAAPRPRREPARALVPAPNDDGGPLLLGGIAMAMLAVASGSLLVFVARAGNTSVRRWETKT